MLSSCLISFHPHTFHFILLFHNHTTNSHTYTLSLHDALPICSSSAPTTTSRSRLNSENSCFGSGRSEEHTSELQSLTNLVCRLVLEKKKGGYRKDEWWMEDFDHNDTVVCQTEII